MSTQHILPNDAAVHGIFTMMYGEEMELKSGNPVKPDAGNCLFAVYINDGEQPVCACICDYKLAAFVGSALTKIPVGGAEDAAETGEFSKMMLDNVQEIMNICSRLFMDSDSPHLKLDAIYATVEAVPEGAQTMINSCQGQVDYNITIPGYGCGDISFVTT